MTRTILDIHVLQTVPPSNLNRDDTGSPKSAVYGGVRRARVSSQAWKRATREAFEHLLDPTELGVRTRKVAEALAERITAHDPAVNGADAVTAAAELMRAATGSKIDAPKRKAAKDQSEDSGQGPAPEASYLMFLSRHQLDGLAALAVEGLSKTADLAACLKDKDNKARARALAATRHSVDIALFGRMVADTTDMNVDAATQVAHAISVHAVENESDYFTAVDDRNTGTEPGAGMIGTVDFNSSTLYRYAALDVDQLRRNLGQGVREGEPATTPVRRAVEAFLRAFITSLPGGKINTFGNHTLPDAVLVKLRTGRPVSFAAAFEEPVPAGPGGGYLRGACAALAAHVPSLEAAYGTKDDAAWILRVGAATEPLTGLGTAVTLDELVDNVATAAVDHAEPQE